MACIWVVTVTVVNWVRFWIYLQDRPIMVRAVACEGKKGRKNDSKEFGGHVAKSNLPIS